MLPTLDAGGKSEEEKALKLYKKCDLVKFK
jgi:hypothetical protein